MRIVATLTGLLMCVTSAGAQPDEIESIDDWVNDVSQMIQDYELIKRYISYTHKTVPAIGSPGTIEHSVTIPSFEDHINC